MKGKALGILTVVLLLVAILPAAPVGAAQGTLDLVQPGSTFPNATGFANPGADGIYGNTDDPGSNILKFKVTDSDLNTNRDLAGACSTLKANLTGKCTILGTGDGATQVFDLDASISPAVAPVTAKDLQPGGLAYTTAIGDHSTTSVVGGSITVQPVPADIPTVGDTAGVDAVIWERVDVTGQTAAVTSQPIADVSAATRLRVSVTDLADVTPTAVTITIAGTKVNLVTLDATTATATLVFAADASATATHVQTTDEYFLPATTTRTLTWSSSGITTGVNGFRVRIQETRTLVATFQFGVSNDTDSGSGTAAAPYAQTVKVTSTSNSAGLNLSLYETESDETTSKTSGVFRQVVANYSTWKADKTGGAHLSKGVALIDSTLLTTIEGRKASASPAAYQFTDASTLAQVITALTTSDPNTPDVTTTTTVDESKNAAGADWIASTAQTTGLGTSHPWSHLRSITLFVAHADVVTITYTDASSGATAASKTVTIDLSKPTLTGVSPAASGSINTGSPGLKASIAEVGTGLGTIKVYQAAGDVACPAALAPILSLAPTGATSFDVNQTVTGLTGDNTWCLVVTDRVNNVGETGKVKFTVDTTVPTLASSDTGIGLRLATGARAGTDQYEEFFSSSWIKATMSEKVSAPSPAAFDLEGLSPPAEVAVQKKVWRIKADGTYEATMDTDLRTVVYLKASRALTPAEKPVVRVTGTVADLAGNSAPTGTATGASVTPGDKIAPTLTVTLSGTLGKKDDKVTVTVTSDELLLGNVPSIKVAGTGVSTTETGTNSWTATYTIAGSAANEVTVDGSDAAGNAGTAKDKDGVKVKNAVNTTLTALSFEGDLLAPAITYAIVDADAATAGNQVETEDVIFIPVNGNDCGASGAGTCLATDATKGEYAGDTRKKVTIDSAKLETLDKLTAAGGAAPVVDATKTVTLTVSDFQTSNTINYVLGLSSLALGNYKLSVTGKDEAGNVMTTAATVEFAVVKRKPAQVALQPGWSLVSIPGRPQAIDIGSVFSDPDTGAAMSNVTQVWSFNNETKVWEFSRWNTETKAWEGTLITITDGRAYFVRSTSFDPIKTLLQAFSPQRTPPQYTVKAGWNGIGYTPGGKETRATVKSYLQSLGTDWGVIRWWNPVAQAYETAWPDETCTAGFPNVTAAAVCGATAADKPIVEAGKGYLLFMKKDGTLGP